jgi:general secretion pathway protein I
MPGEKRLESARGFTLIEAMVALVIVALGMIAVNMQLGRFAESAIRTEDKTLASWIATNKITELSIQPTWPSLGHEDDDVDFAGRKWHAHVEILKTPDENLRRVDVSVSLAEHPDDVVQRVSGFIEPPIPAGLGGAYWLTAAGAPQTAPPSGRSDNGQGGDGEKGNSAGVNRK